MAYLSNGAMNEIILPSGALGSRQLLTLSGIGRAQQLSNQGIKVILDQPNVGQGMSDNPMNSVFIPSPQPVELSLVQVVGITQFCHFTEAASGILSWFGHLGLHKKFQNSNIRLVGQLSPQFFDCTRFIATSIESFRFEAEMLQKMQTDHPFIVPLNVSMQEAMLGPDPYQYANLQAGVILEKIVGPFSTGHLKLQSRDPMTTQESLSTT
ncbi:HOTHEAD-like isoform X1 [Olea europaea subsp. europaea]|uniref:HOTHEAD-like isoform X1 n=1 Tax=Olea europaea subsp. europaea TaxID=158383 RepID=A0A8S0UY58_OLEEU|nr:HOTHEAD-like isoform X1 [Olea europaea subsp. europaea]